MADNNHNKNVEEKRKRLEKMMAEENHDKELREMIERFQNMFSNVKNNGKNFEEQEFEDFIFYNHSKHIQKIFQDS